MHDFDGGQAGDGLSAGKGYGDYNKLEGGVTTSYYYADLSGNPLYNQLNRTVTGATTWYYNYNRNGDLVWKNGTSVRWNYQFDAMGRLSKVVKGGVTVGEYSYDANGARARTVEGSTTVDYLFLGHDPCTTRTGRCTASMCMPTVGSWRSSSAPTRTVI